MKAFLNFLMIFVVLAGVSHYYFPEAQTYTFIFACIGIIPLAGWLGTATEHVAERTSDAVGGFLNATFGNAAELIIAIVALSKGHTEVVKASLTGSIIGNTLLVFGAACFIGGLKRPNLNFNIQGARIQATSLILAVIALMIPALFHYTSHAAGVAVERHLSLEIAIVLLLIYLVSLIFSLRTHKQLFSSSASDLDETEHVEHVPWSLKKAFAVLVLSTVAIAWLSEMLVASVEHAAHALGMNSIFIGVIVVALVGNAAEHSTAVLMALKNRMDLALGIAVGSSIQIALFVAPLLVLLSYYVAAEPMDLVFTTPELLAIAASVYITGEIAGDGEVNWFEGLQLLTVYTLLGFFFYSLPG